MNGKKFGLLLVLIVQTLFLTAQNNVLIGTWKGTLENMDAEGNYYTIWKVRIKVTDKDKAELFLYDDNKSAYISYLSDPRFAAQKRKVTFTSNNNSGALIVTYEGTDNTDGISVYNMYYNNETNSVQVLWSNNSKKALTDTKYILGFGDFVSDQPDVKTYMGVNLIVGGQSFNYLSISSITKTKQKTSVTINIKNNTTTKLDGTYHEPGSATAFYITNADRSKKYKLTGASYSLPYTFTLKPGETSVVTLHFEPIPDNMKILNIFEGGDVTATNLWKFFDVVLKDQ